MDPHFKQNILLFAEVIVPDLHQNQALKYHFLKNFKKMFKGLEKEPASKIKLLVKAIEKLSFLYTFQPYARLNYQKRQNYIKRLFNFPVGKISGGLTGLRSLVLVSYYGIDQTWEKIRYEGPLSTTAE